MGYEIVKMLFVTAIFITYGLMMFVPMELIWPLIARRIKAKKWIAVYEFLFRSLLITLTFSLASIIPHLGPFISLIGAFASVALALLFPVIIDTVVKLPTDDFGKFRWKLVKNVGIFVFGFIGFVAGTFCSIRDVISAFQGGNEANSALPLNCTHRVHDIAT